MTRAERDDMVVISMGIEALLACVRQTETWWRLRGNHAELRRTQQLAGAILATRRKFFADESDAGAPPSSERWWTKRTGVRRRLDMGRPASRRRAYASAGLRRHTPIRRLATDRPDGGRTAAGIGLR